MILNYISKLETELKNQIIETKVEIYGSDNNQKNIRICRENINSIFNYNSIKIKNVDFLKQQQKKIFCSI